MTVRLVHRRATRLGLGAAALVAAGSSALAAQAPDSAAYVTRLGNDTLAVERIVATPGRVEAEVLLRAPRTTLTRYVLELAPDGMLRRLESATLDPQAPDAPPRRTQLTERQGDSLVVTSTADGQSTRRAIAAPAATLPFIDMVHWPYEVALRHMRAAGRDSVAQPLLSGRAAQDFVLRAIGTDSVSITHPYRGTMRARIDARGRILGLDAAGTTRKLVVERRPWLAIDALARRYVAADAAGRSVGELSGRGNDTVTVKGARIALDFGVPTTRGRAIWGALVPYGQVWRTGANRATHFSTTQGLRFGDLVVPAGEYTLFSIPAADGGVLIINRQTGQTGTAHDPARDLGRVPLTRRALPSAVEAFTIRVTETPAGGELRLQWDDAELVAPFTVGMPVRK